MPEFVSGAEMARDLIHSCQERIAHYHTKGCEEEQAGKLASAHQWYQLSESENQLLQTYWALGGRRYLEGNNGCLPTVEPVR